MSGNALKWALLGPKLNPDVRRNSYIRTNQYERIGCSLYFLQKRNLTSIRYPLILEISDRNWNGVLLPYLGGCYPVIILQTREISKAISKAFEQGFLIHRENQYPGDQMYSLAILMTDIQKTTFPSFTR